jgi:hypothetical protein
MRRRQIETSNLQGPRRDMTPRQKSLSGVIICPAYWMGQRFRVNSITTASDYKRERNQLSIGTLGEDLITVSMEAELNQ